MTTNNSTVTTPAVSTSATSSAVVTTTSSPSDESLNILPIAGGAAAGAAILILFVCVLIIVVVAYIISSRRGSKGAERQWRQQEEQIDNYSIHSMPEKSPEPHVNGIEMGLPSPIPATPSYGPIYIDPHYEFPRENVELTDILYDGTFTVIYKATAIGINEKPIEVAIKAIKEEYQEMDDYSSALIMEMEQLAQLEPHPNIVGLIRVCSVSRPVYMVMEYMCHGDLLGFLRATRGHTDMYSVFPGTKKLPTHLKLTSHDLLNIIRQVATGMQFLSEQKIVHGALRARNILVGTSMEVKIFNIGAHNLDNNESFDSLVRWMAPEVFIDGLRTIHGDIWSFGILMWEVVTLGGTPYAELLPDDLYTQLISEMRLPKPQHCAQPVYDVMNLCWQTIPNHRPLFDEIYEHLHNLNISKVNYLDMRNYNEMEYSQFEDSERQLVSVLAGSSSSQLSVVDSAMLRQHHESPNVEVGVEAIAPKKDVDIPEHTRTHTETSLLSGQIPGISNIELNNPQSLHLEVEVEVETIPPKKEIDIPKLKKLLSDVLDKYYAKLHDASIGAIQELARLMFQYGLVSRDVLTKPDYEEMIKSFRSTLDWDETQKDLEKDCKRFIDSLIQVGGPARKAGEKIASDWMNVAKQELGIDFKVDFLKQYC